MTTEDGKRLKEEIEGLRKAIKILDDRCVQLIEVVNLQDKTILERELEERIREVARERILRTREVADHIADAQQSNQVRP